MIDVVIHSYDFFQIAKHNKNVISFTEEINNGQSIGHPLFFNFGYFHFNINGWIANDLIDYNKNKKVSKRLYDYIEKKVESEYNKHQENKINEKEIKKIIGFVYLIKSIDKYKIGRTQHEKTRLSAYRTENPYKIDVIICEKVKDCFSLEKEIIKKFDTHKFRGEWFCLNEDDIKIIKNMIIKNKV